MHVTILLSFLPTIVVMARSHTQAWPCLLAQGHSLVVVFASMRAVVSPLFSFILGHILGAMLSCRGEGCPSWPWHCTSFCSACRGKGRDAPFGCSACAYLAVVCLEMRCRQQSRWDHAQHMCRCPELNFALARQAALCPIAARQRCCT